MFNDYVKKDLSYYIGSDEDKNDLIKLDIASYLVKKLSKSDYSNHSILEDNIQKVYNKYYK